MVPATDAARVVPAMFKLTLAPATVVPVMAVFFSRRLMTPSVAMLSIPTEAFTCTSELDTTEFKLVAPEPFAVVAAVCAPATITSIAAVLRVAVLPETVNPENKVLMVVCTLPELAASAPDSAARTAPYFSAIDSTSGVNLALAAPVMSTVVTTVSLMRSVRPKALATAAFVWVTTSAVMTALLAPENTAPAFMAARVVSTLRFK